MGQKKGRKNNPKSQANGKPKDGTKLNAHLAQIGLKVVDITADGNCLFRAVADQLEGNEEEHIKYRNMVVDFIEAHREDYEPFLEDEVPFDEYCKTMREPSTWAGHMELQAISLVTHTNICIHRPLSPRWHIQNFTSKEARCIHLSYHNGEHYNSIRRVDDNGEGPAKPITLEKGPVEKAVSDTEKTGKQNGPNNKKSIKNHNNFAEKAYEEDYNNGSEDNNDQLPLQDHTNANTSDLQNIIDHNQESSCTKSKVNDPNAGEGTVRASRNKACPCGSKKKYKACCGAAKPQTRHHETASSTEGLSNKARKQKLRNNKEKPKLESVSNSSKNELDLGYLCI